MKKISALLCIIALICAIFLVSCSSVKYSFFYHTNSDLELDSITKEKSELESYTLPTPTKEGYSFVGWYLDSGLTKEYNPSKLVDGINELYAKYTINEYTITVHNEDNTTKEYKFNYNDKITLDELEKDDYIFNGYYTDVELTKKFTLTIMPAYEVSLYPSFTKKVHNQSIVYHTNSDLELDSITKEKSELESYTLPTPTKEGYSFVGWYLDSGLTKEYNPSKLVDGINELYAKYTINEYTITVHNEDNTTKEYKFNYNDKITLDELEKDDYIFNGYYTDVELTKKFTLTIMPFNNIDIYPSFSKIIHFYTIKYLVDCSMGYLVGDSIQKVEENMETNEVEVIALDGYRFVGWNDNNTSSKRSDIINDNVSFTAQFEKLYKLTVISNNPEYGYIEGETIQLLSFEEESSNLKAIPNIGYKFKSWSNDSTKSSLKVTITEDTLIYANFVLDCLELPVIEICTEDRAEIVSKDEYINCKISISNAEYKYCFDSLDAGIKGRGNTTWTREEKKPYKIKFAKKQNLFDLGSDKSKKWVLLANADDCSLMRNLLALKFARTLDGIDWNPNCKAIDLYVNGNYRGVYLLAEQVEEGTNRVDIDLSDLNKVSSIDYLIELSMYANEYDSNYIEINGKKYEVKSDLSTDTEIKNLQRNDIKAFMEECWYAVKYGTREEVESLIDIDSLVDAYLVEEILKNLDMGYDSFYLYRKDGKLFFGPVWDFDLSLGNGNETCELCEGLYCAIYRCGDNGNKELSNYWFYGIMTKDWFRNLVKERFNEIYQDLTQFFDKCIVGELENYNSYIRNFDLWTNSFGVKHDRETELILSLNTFDEHVDYLKNWISNRISWLNEYYDSDDFSSGNFIVYDELISDLGSQ